jgi:hypothetical protein
MQPGGEQRKRFLMREKSSPSRHKDYDWAQAPTPANVDRLLYVIISPSIMRAPVGAKSGV